MTPKGGVAPDLARAGGFSTSLPSFTFLGLSTHVRLLEYYRQRQKRYGDRLVSRRAGDSTPRDEDAA